MSPRASSSSSRHLARPSNHHDDDKSRTEFDTRSFCGPPTSTHQSEPASWKSERERDGSNLWKSWHPDDKSLSSCEKPSGTREPSRGEIILIENHFIELSNWAKFSSYRDNSIRIRLDERLSFSIPAVPFHSTKGSHSLHDYYDHLSECNF